MLSLLQVDQGEPQENWISAWNSHSRRYTNPSWVMTLCEWAVTPPPRLMAVFLNVVLTGVHRAGLWEELGDQEVRTQSSRRSERFIRLEAFCFWKMIWFSDCWLLFLCFRPCILVMDSLKLSYHNNVCRLIREWVSAPQQPFAAVVRVK